MLRALPLVLLALAACPGSPKPDGGTGGGGSATGGGGSAVGGGAATGGGGGGEARDASVTGFIFTGPLDAGGYVSSNAYVWFPSDGGSGAPSASIGSPCGTGNDCVALGFGAGCFSNGDAGFCSTACPGESDLCDAGYACMRGLSTDVLGSDVGLCLPTCSTSADCVPDQGLDTCSGPFITFNPGFPLAARGCFPGCASDADCNGLMCNPGTHRCVFPAAYLGSQCASDADCSDLAPGASCLVDQRNPSNRYCTYACDPSSAFNSDPCVTNYATFADGGRAAIAMRLCNSDLDCQFASSNTCNYFPDRGRALCTIRCASDADCLDGACDVASGDCRQGAFWASDCAANNNCSTGLCVADFHNGTAFNCSSNCLTDTECPAGAVCVFSPVAVDPERGHISFASDAGFCAPSCAADGGVCSSATDSCLAPVLAPEIDFAGSAAASSNFCWR